MQTSNTIVEINLSSNEGEQVGKDRYQRLVGKLIYLSLTRPNMTYAVSIVSHLIYDRRIQHIEDVYRY